MLGKDANYVPGWDCHGLPIEWKIEEEYRAKGQDKDAVPIAEFRKVFRDILLRSSRGFFPQKSARSAAEVAIPCQPLCLSRFCRLLLLVRFVASVLRSLRENCWEDPAGQGERDIYSHVDTGGKLSCKTPCDAHNILGRQLHAGGEWFGTWRLWDGIRATDYLASRPEVDATKLAVTGQSGGGTLSAYLWAMDSRLRAVASSCWATSYLNDAENAMPADEEQYPPGWLAAGLDKIDFFNVRAGEPTLLLGQEQDFFDDRGLKSGYAELRRLHGLVGGDPATCVLSMDVKMHEYSDAAQLAMLTFFNRVFGKPAPAPLRPVPEQNLQVTPQGDVWKAGSRPIPELDRKSTRLNSSHRT